MNSMDLHYCHEGLCIQVLPWDCSATSLPMIKLRICFSYVSTEWAGFQFCPWLHHREDNDDRNENNNDDWQRRPIFKCGICTMVEDGLYHIPCFGTEG